MTKNEKGGVINIEKILGIKTIEVDKNRSTMAGYEVITTEQSIKLLINSEQDCCERWGYFWCNDDPKEFIGAEIRNISVTDTALKKTMLRENDVNPLDEMFDGGIMFVNIDTDQGILQFVAYNEHNGYYGHEATIECKYLNHYEIL